MVDRHLWLKHRPVLLAGQDGLDYTAQVDSSESLQSVLTANPGRKVDFGEGGRLRIDSPLIGADYQALVGPVSSMARTSVPEVELHFPSLAGTQVGLTLGAGSSVKDLTLRGPGFASTATGIANAGPEVTLERVLLMSWGTGSSLTNAYYAVVDRCSWRACGVGMKARGCYNLALLVPRFNGANEAGNAYGAAVDAGTVRGLTVHGGSVENYPNTGGLLFDALSVIDCFGTYWESAASNAVGIQSVGAGSVVNLVGNMVYLTGSFRWLNMGSAGAGCVVNGRGNKFVCPPTSATAPTAYHVHGTNVALDVAGDEWGEVAKGGALYVNDGLLGLTGQTVSVPGQAVEHRGRALSVPAPLWLRGGRGTTANRPNPATAGSGSQWFDTTLGKPIWSTGAGWVDATGVTA